MRVLVQRVNTAWVRFADGSETRRSGPGLLGLVGFAAGDGPELLAPMARKLVQLRIFEDEEGRMNRALEEVGGDLTLVSQFTLYADLRKGRRPSFVRALAPDAARALFERFVEQCRETVPSVATGRFGEPMAVHLVNDGPVTLMLDSDELMPDARAAAPPRA